VVQIHYPLQAVKTKERKNVMSTAAQIILLDHNFTFLNVVSIKKAIRLMVKNKVEVVKSTERELRCGFFMPKVIRLLKAIQVTFSKKVPFSKASVFVRDHYKCQYCGRELNARNATVDHVVPTSRGGKNTFQNTVCSCKPCNSWKGDKLLSETSMHLNKQPLHPTFSEFMFAKMRCLGIDLKDIWS
jgi:5-methylcytosine-specific restriction endonuclease McrA